MSEINQQVNPADHLLNAENPLMQRWSQIQRVAGPIGANALLTQKRAETDELTGLKNRFAIVRELNEIMTQAPSDAGRYIAMFMDLDGFKPVNDTYGHEAGNKVLKSVANRLQLRKTDIVGRLGGDEFLVIVDTANEAPDRRGSDRLDPNPRRKRQTRSGVTKGLSEHIREEVVQAGIDAGYSGIAASIGVVELNGHSNAEEVIKAADKKMYVDKQRKSERLATL